MAFDAINGGSFAVYDVLVENTAVTGTADGFGVEGLMDDPSPLLELPCEEVVEGLEIVQILLFDFSEIDTHQGTIRFENRDPIDW